MTVGVRVKRLREMHSLTQASLVSDIPGLTQSRLSRIESGLSSPDDEILELLAIALGVRSDYFFRESLIDLIGQSPQLRARSRLTQAAKSSVVHWANLIYEEYERLESGSGIPNRLSRDDGHLDPAHAARATRDQLGFDQSSPLPYIVLAVERLGVAILGIPSHQPAMDAFCAWHNDRPVIGLLEGAPPDRVRWSIAHELGHLVLHRGQAKTASMEAEADQFAAELLTPLHALKKFMPRRPTLSHFTVLKTQWGVSIKSLVRRAKELEVLDQDRAIGLYRQISARGWNKTEPGFVAEEKPRGFRKLVELRYPGESLGVDNLAKDASWSTDLAIRILRRHAGPDDLPYDTIDPTRSDNVVDLGFARRSRAMNRQLLQG
ncbi:ImmA/IrrE family metallo-endopeptidase [Pseudonocardia benzenivorans]|uniref:ImmA/IrrE family metallo-endopeptidase n=1 Tax=Pseudonocardia benzenivorans TaxID=228005 RepID=A0ABW3VAC1_9PSEU